MIRPQLASAPKKAVLTRAEVATLHGHGEQWWLTPDEAVEQEARAREALELDGALETLSDYLAQHPAMDSFRLSDFFDALGVPDERRGTAETRRLTSRLRRLGLERRRSAANGGGRWHRV